MTNKDNPDAYRNLTYVASYHTDLGVKLSRKEKFAISAREYGKNSIGVVYERDEIPHLLAARLLGEFDGRFLYDSVSFILNNANINTMPKETYEAMLQISPRMLLQRGTARVCALGEEGKLLEDIAQKAIRLLEISFGKETLQRLAPHTPGAYNHDLPTTPVVQ